MESRAQIPVIFQAKTHAKNVSIELTHRNFFLYNPLESAGIVEDVGAAA